MSPLTLYVRGNTLRHPTSEELRPLRASEQEPLMGFPKGTRRLSIDPKGELDREHTRMSALESSFHIPCFRFVPALLICPQSASAGPGFPAVPSRTEQSCWADKFSEDTVWRSGRQPSPSMARSASEVVEAAFSQCPCQTFASRAGLVSRVCTQLGHLCIAPLFGFQCWAQARGATSGSLDPDIQALWRKSPIRKAVGRQHRSDTPGNQLQDMIEWGLGPQGHGEAARALTHPFADLPATELDLELAIQAYTAIGLRIIDVRRRRPRMLAKVAKILLPLDQELLSRRHLVLPNAPWLRPVYVAFCVELTQWPDRDLLFRLLDGFPLAGPLPESDVLLPTPSKDPGKGGSPAADEEFLGPAALAYIGDLESGRRAPTSAAEIGQATLDEIQ